MRVRVQGFTAISAIAVVALLISGCGSSGSAPATNASSSSSSMTVTPTPTPTPTTGTTISNIEQMSGWSSCDTCSGGGTVPYSMTQGLSYPQPGTTQFSIGHGTAWAQALWWNRLGNDSTISHFVLSLDQYIEDPSSSWGVEYNVNQLLNGEWYKFSTQCSFGDGIWQVWDSANQQWTPTSVPCARPTPYTHVQLQMQYERTNGQAHFISIAINGTTYSVDKLFNPQPISGTSGDFGVHFQLNGDANSDPYSVWVHNLQLNYW